MRLEIGLFFCEFIEVNGKLKIKEFIMFIVIEGIHDTGKTTLINKICEKSNYLLYEGKRLFPELANVNNVSISDFSTGGNCAITWFAKNFSDKADIIFDRLHLSEYAYSKLFRNVNEIVAMNRFRMINDKLSTYNVKMIYLYCNYETLISRSKQRNTLVYNEEHHKKLTEYYENLIKNTSMANCCIDTGKFNEVEVYDKVLQFLKGE